MRAWRGPPALNAAPILSPLSKDVRANGTRMGLPMSGGKCGWFSCSGLGGTRECLIWCSQSWLHARTTGEHEKDPHLGMAIPREVKEPTHGAEDMNSNNLAKDERGLQCTGVERFLFHLHLGCSIILFSLICLLQGPEL